MILGAAVLADAAPVVNWVTINGDAGFSGGSAATASPSVNGLPGDTIAAGFPVHTLATGESITLTGAVTFNGSIGGTQFRIGIFDGTSPPVAGNGSGYIGIYADAPTTTTGTIKYSDGSATNPFSSSASTTIGTMSNPGAAPPGNIPITFSLKITRLGGNLEAEAALVNTAAGGTWSTTGTANWTPPAGYNFRYSTVAFLLGNSIGATTAAFSNIAVSVVAPVGDTDKDGLADSVETGTGIFVNANDTGTDPLKADTDGDGLLDGLEVANGTDPNDPNDPPLNLRARLFGIDFNRDDAFGSPSQSGFRVISGLTTQAANAASYTKKIGLFDVTVSQPGATAFEFRGANTDSTRAIPGGDTSKSFLVADFIATRKGAIDISITNLPAGDYFFRSCHLDTLTGSGLGFAQGASSTSPNTIEARIGSTLMASVQPTALGPSGLNTTFINDLQIPTLRFHFTHADGSPLNIHLTSTETNGPDSYLLLNGFELLPVTGP